MTHAIEFTVAIFLLVLGASYLFQHQHWREFFRQATQRPWKLFPLALAMLASGTFIGTIYNDWTSTWPIFITCLAWLTALEGALLLIFPGTLKFLENLSDRFLSWYVRGGGLLLIILGALLLRYQPG